MKSLKISSSGNSNNTLGSTLAALNTTQLNTPPSLVDHFSTSLNTSLYILESVISTSHVSTSTFLSFSCSLVEEEREDRRNDFSRDKLDEDRARRAIFENCDWDRDFWEKRVQIDRPIPGPEPIRRSVCGGVRVDDIVGTLWSCLCLCLSGRE